MKIFGFIFALAMSSSFAFTFEEAIEKIEKHPKIETLISEVNILREKGDEESSWGDPILAVKARNVPKDSLALDESPMSGIEYTVSQRLPLTTRFSRIEDSYEKLAQAKGLSMERQKKALQSLVWKLAISKRQLLSDIKILKENLSFLNNMLDVTKRLYANAKTSQQAVLELQIRKSELEAKIDNLNFGLKELMSNFSYLSEGLAGEFEHESAPWRVLKVSFQEKVGPDERQLELKKSLEASELGLRAQKLSYVPDINLNLGYVQRDSQVDDYGDFVSVGVSFSLPLSAKKYAQSDLALAKKIKARHELSEYELSRKSELKRLEAEILKMRNELKILDSKTLPFGKSAREITSKSYGLGNASYIELTQAELRLQNLWLRRNKLEGELSSKSIDYLYLRGDDLI